MVVEHAVPGANDRLAVSGRIPGYAKARSHIVVVARNAFDDAERLFGGGVHGGGRSKERRDFDVVANAVVDTEMAVHAPAVLQEKGHRLVVERMVGIPNTLDVGSWNSKTVGLQPSCSWNARTKESQSAEIDVAAKVEFEDLRLFGAQLDEVVVATNFKRVAAADECHIVGKFETALDAIHG